MFRGIVFRTFRVTLGDILRIYRGVFLCEKEVNSSRLLCHNFMFRFK
jgi:hypothetical protein